MSQTLADSIYNTLHDVLLRRIPEQRLIADETRRLAYGTDASFYRLIPQIVVQADDLDDIVFIIKTCGELNVPFTFRAAGTSLSGQAVSDSVLITLTDNWRQHTILEDGKKIQLQPGVIGADANRYLAPFDRKIGPDPASINSCKIGGIAANNASGMCCGTAQNTYNTVESMKIVADVTLGWLRVCIGKAGESNPYTKQLRTVWTRNGGLSGYSFLSCLSAFVCCVISLFL